MPIRKDYECLNKIVWYRRVFERGFIPIPIRWLSLPHPFQELSLTNLHYNDVIMTTIASQITSLAVVYSTVYSDADKKKPSKLHVTGLCVGNSPWPVNSPHKGPVTRKMFPIDDVIMFHWIGFACVCVSSQRYIMINGVASWTYRTTYAWKIPYMLGNLLYDQSLKLGNSPKATGILLVNLSISIKLKA